MGLDYDKLEGRELSMAIAKLLAKTWPNAPKGFVDDPKRETGVLIEADGGGYAAVDYSNHGIMASLAFSNYISVINIGGSTMWMACVDSSLDTVCMSPDGNDNGVSVFNCKHETYDVDPLRAIAICLLKSKAWIKG